MENNKVKGISIREAIEKINNKNSGDKWFLPAVQRKYVWGSKNNNTKYIFKFFDSIMRGFPIGILTLWKEEGNDKCIIYKPFITNYDEESLMPDIIEDKVNDKNRYLVYDGQQRMQTLYSCLCFKFNKEFLVYNMAFNLNDIENSYSNTGFRFVAYKNDIANNEIAMNDIYNLGNVITSKAEFKERMLQLINPSDEELKFVNNNIEIMYKNFIEKGEDATQIYYYNINDNIKQANEIFQRLNIGGVPLTQIDLVLSKIKEYYPEFEKKLYDSSKKIKEKIGYDWDYFNTIQFTNLYIKGSIHVKSEQVEAKDIDEFVNKSELMIMAISDTLTFLNDKFKIADSRLLVSEPALYLLIVFFCKMLESGNKYEVTVNQNEKELKKLLLISQLNMWNTEKIINNVSKKIISNCNENNLKLPMDEILKYVENFSDRKIQLIKDSLKFRNLEYFLFKILCPEKTFKFKNISSSSRNRIEMDHIFPAGLKNKPQDYYYDETWNMQPIIGFENNHKRSQHPLNYFNTEDGRKNYCEYDFLPELDSEEWNDFSKFIDYRRDKMIAKLEELYDIKVVVNNNR